ncbi:MAG: DUF4136 domain-containing protein [Acidiferrobacterales bacterium]
MIRSSIFTFALLILCAPAWAQKVSVDFDKSADFEKYKTFSWKDSNEDLRDTDPLFHDRIVRGIERRLREGGMTQVAKDPDAYVTYYTAEREETAVHTVSMGYGMGSSWFWGSGVAGSTSQVVKYKVGTLIIDIWDAKTSKLVWRGTASDTVSEKPAKVEKQIEKALDKLVRRWHREYRKLQKNK